MNGYYLKLYVQISCVDEVASLPISQSQLNPHWGIRCKERSRYWSHQGRFQGLNRICCQSQGPPLNLPQLNTRYNSHPGENPRHLGPCFQWSPPSDSIQCCSTRFCWRFSDYFIMLIYVGQKTVFHRKQTLTNHRRQQGLHFYLVQ